MSSAPLLPPPLAIPPSQQTVTISILNTTARIDHLPTSYHYPSTPTQFTHLYCPCLAFLIEHGPSGKKLLFDLGMRKDWHNLAPSIVAMIEAVGAKITIERDVAEILESEGVELGDIDGIIWSHHHCDHTGSPSLFPPTTDLYVGPGFKPTFLPGHPTNLTASILESDYQSRQTHEIPFDTRSSTSSSPLQIAGFRAHDFFADGSFYILDAPGHSPAHLSALARTTAADPASGRDATFIFLGADCAHHGGEFRPSRYMPLPREIELFNDPRGRCPGSLFAGMHRLAPSPMAYTEPFLVCKGAVTHDVETRETIEKVQVLDASEDVLVVMAHDQSLMDVVGFWPESANEWKVKGWKGRGLWGFLEDFGEIGGKEGKRSVGLGRGIKVLMKSFYAGHAW